MTYYDKTMKQLYNIESKLQLNKLKKEVLKHFDIHKVTTIPQKSVDSFKHIPELYYLFIDYNKILYDSVLNDIQESMNNVIEEQKYKYRDELLKLVYKLKNKYSQKQSKRK